MKRTIFLIFLIMILITVLGAERISLGSAGNSLQVLQSSAQETILQYRIQHFDQREVQVEGRKYYQISLPDEGITQEKGLPELPVFNRSIAIDGMALMKLEVFDLEYTDIKLPVVPSKGVITRDIDPATVPYTFGSVYQSSSFYPQSIATLSEPYILRDFRGITIKSTPFAYRADTQTLRIYSAYKVRVYQDGEDTINTMISNRQSISRAFAPLYEQHFVNWQAHRYSPVDDSYGKLLVVCHSSFLNSIQSWVNWKKQKGIETELVEWSSIGTTATQLQSYIQNRYNLDSSLSYVQIVGDAPQIPTLTSGGGGSDPSFSLVAGNDNYPDIFIGRFSAETVDQLSVQLHRSIAYERDAAISDTWLSRAIGIASAEGGGSQGDNGESDIQHMNNIRTKLLNYGYSSVDQVYDPGAAASTVSSNINAGRGFLNYVGHGSDTTWSTTGFSVNNAMTLTNGHKAPFIVDVACVNGNFVARTCFAEGWMRSPNGGAITIYASTINQSWNSPMLAQDEITDLWISGAKTSAGGLYYNGACKMMDSYGNTTGSDGVNMFKTWHIFGDASLMARSKTPVAITVTHPQQIVIGTSNMNVNTGVPNALVALSYNQQIYARGFSNSSGNLSLALANLPAGSLNYTLTVTAHNRVTYVGSVQQIPGTEPYVTVENIQYVDGNNQAPDYGDSASFNVRFQNQGAEAASDLNASLSTSTPGISITIANAALGNLAAHASITRNNAFAFSIADNLAHGTVAQFSISMVSGSDSWTHEFPLSINAPMLSFGQHNVADPSGNNNGKLDPGETVTLNIAIWNEGGAASSAGLVNLSSATPGISITPSTANFAAIAAGGSRNLSFILTADSAMAAGTLATFSLNAIAGAYLASQNLNLEVGAPETITIGTGTATQTYPLDRYYNYSSHEAIYLASEIASSGAICSIGYYKASGSDTNSIEATNIYMKHTTANSLSSGTYSTAGYTLVYSGPFSNSATSGWMEVDLSQRFDYDGVSNLYILVIKGNQNWTSSYPNWTYSSSSSSRSRQGHNDYAQPSSLTSTNNLPNLRLKIYQSSTASAPFIAVSPDSISETVDSGSSLAREITISNTGTEDLIWSIPERSPSKLELRSSLAHSFSGPQVLTIEDETQTVDWFGLSAHSGSIAPGANTIITLSLDAEALADGIYTSSFSIVSNASNNPILSFQVSLTVVTPVNPYPVQPRFVAEWEPAQGAIVRYPFGQPYSLLRDLANDALLYVIVSSTYQSTAHSNLQANGVNMANVHYVNAASDSYWVRDYAAWTILDAEHNMHLVDFNYNRPRPNDNLMPSVFASYLSTGLYDLQMNHTGGNIMTDGMGKAMSTQLVSSENSNLSAVQINQRFSDLLGITEYQIYTDPTNTYIDHIDCWAKLVDVDKVLIRRVPASHPQYNAIEQSVAQWQAKTSSYGQPYRIFRVDTPNNEPYSNAFIMNANIYVPQMNSSYDAAALAVYRTAMPGFTVRGYIHSTYESTDALHCRVNTVFDAQMIAVRHSPVSDLTAYQEYTLSVEIDHANPLHAEQSFIAWSTSSSGPWQQSSLSHNNGSSYSASITTSAHLSSIYYWIQASDSTGRITTLPLCAGLDPFVALVSSPNPNLPNWVPVQYPNPPASVRAQITLFGQAAGANDLVAAFVNGECRGTALVTLAGNPYVNIPIALAQSGESVTFKLFSQADAESYDAALILTPSFGENLGLDLPIQLIFSLEAPTVSLSVNGSHLLLSWTAVINADAYRILASDLPDAGFNLFMQSSATSLSIPATAAKKFYKVIAQRGQRISKRK